MDPDSYTVKYPLAHAGGYRGTKTAMRKAVNGDIRRELQLRSPKPPRSRWFRPHHQGHPTTAPILCTSKPEKAGSWIQMCNSNHVQVGCGRPFVLVQPLGGEHALQSPFRELYAIRNELAQVPRAHSLSSGTLGLGTGGCDPALTTPPSSPVIIDLTLSPAHCATSSSPPSSPVLGATRGRLNESAMVDTVSAKFWITDAAVSPVCVDLECQGGLLYLEKYKEPLGRVGVEKTPMEYYNTRRRCWEAFTWAGGIQLRGKKDIAIKAKGLDVALDI
ncbi:hypothetical protein V5O48_013077 [Marasmius crinis-equi]|uniref:Uncharacterized protein n=1 Tax=Marasmius crinis-equi TaxID=585013 RepID=A0ABR3F131_9AGAR